MSSLVGFCTRMLCCYLGLKWPYYRRVAIEIIAKIWMPYLVRGKGRTILVGSSSSTGIRTAALWGDHQDTAVVCRIWNNIFYSICGCKSVTDGVGVDDTLTLIDAQNLEVLKESIPWIIAWRRPPYLHCSWIYHRQQEIFRCTYEKTSSISVKSISGSAWCEEAVLYELAWMYYYDIEIEYVHNLKWDLRYSSIVAYKWFKQVSSPQSIAAPIVLLLKHPRMGDLRTTATSKIHAWTCL